MLFPPPPRRAFPLIFARAWIKKLGMNTTIKQSTDARAFTLIELLIVVAIIAILAAIAVPNFLEAQTRSKVSRVKADQRTMATAIEAYRVDTNSYPPDGNDIDPFNYANYDVAARQIPLTTPIAYITSIPHDVFHTSVMTNPMLLALFPSPTGPYTFAYLNYGNYYGIPMPAVPEPANAGEPKNWAFVSFGPNQEFDTFSVTNLLEYDPTNGTTSKGDIIRFGGEPFEPVPTP